MGTFEFSNLSQVSSSNIYGCAPETFSTLREPFKMSLPTDGEKVARQASHPG